MKRSTKKPRNISKGAPSGFIISLAFHALAFLLAGMFVVFTVVKKEEKKFVPPKPVERPKMKLKKPKVKVKKTSKPKATKRIVTKMKRASMPDIQLPEMSGMGEGLVGGIGGFEIMPDLDMTSVLGGEVSAGNDLVGTFYTLMRNRNGRPISYSKEDHQQAIRRFLKGGWKTSTLARYYRSPKKLYGSMIVVPTMLSSVAPESFGENAIDSQYWIVHYKGQIVYPEDITFRFVCQADSTVAVRINDEIVIAGYWHTHQEQEMGNIWRSSAADNRKWWMGNWTACVGDWVTLNANEPVDIEILIADAGGLCCLMLAVQEEGVEYETRPGGGPRLPAFKTAIPSHDLQDVVMRDMVPGEISLTNGPVFNDFEKTASDDSPAPVGLSVSEPVATEMAEAVNGPTSRLRTWACKDERSFEAEFVTRMGDKAVMKDARGQQKKILLSQLSEGDLEYLELCSPPDLALSVSGKDEQVFAYEDESQTDVVGHDFIYTGKIRQKSATPYNHELKAEFFAIGVQRYADVYILLDRQESPFILSKENNRSHSFSGEKVHLRKLEPTEWEKSDFTVRGEKNYGYLIVVTDKRGEIIAHKATSPWLFDCYEKLKEFPVGRYLDKNGDRTFPIGPPRARY